MTRPDIRHPTPDTRPPGSRIEPIAFWALILAAAAMIVTAAGCATRSVEWTRTVTTHPDNTVVEQNHVTYLNQGNDTSADEITIGRDADGNPTLHMSKYNSQDMSARAAIEWAGAAKALAGSASP